MGWNLGLQQWLSSKESVCNAGDSEDSGLIPGLGRYPGRGHGNPLQYSCLENPMNRVRHDLAHIHVAYQVALVVKNLPANARKARATVSIPGLGKSPGEENGNPLQYSCLKNPMDRGAWRATVQRVTRT